MQKNWEISDGHIVAKIPMSRELPTMKITIQSRKSIYCFGGNYDGNLSLPSKMFKLMDKDFGIDNENESDD